MDFKVEQPPLKKKKTKRKTKSSSSSPSFLLLPNEIILNCVARVSISYYNSLCLVSKSFHSLLSSPDIYAVRVELGATECRLYMCTPNYHRSWYTIKENNKEELTLVQVLCSSYSPTLLTAASIVAVGSEIFQIGGAINKKESNVVVRRSKAVFVFDCQSNTWRRGPKLTVGRKYAKSCFLNGKIYVIGGCKIDEDLVNCGEVFDLKTQTWKPLSSPSGIIFDQSYYKVVVFGGRLYVMTKNDKYAYDPQEGRWVAPEVDFVGVGPIIKINEPCCVIDNVMFGNNWGEVKWYNPRYEKWSLVYGLHDLFANRGMHQTIQLVNHGGKLVMIWQEKSKNKFCAVIRLERRLNLSLPEFHGEVERCNAVPLSHKRSFLSVSV